jgi:hypothetical protein
MNRRDALACLLGGVGAGVGLTLTHCTDPAKTATVKPGSWSPPPKAGTEIYDVRDGVKPTYFTSPHAWYLSDYPYRPEPTWFSPNQLERVSLS